MGVLRPPQHSPCQLSPSSPSSDLLSQPTTLAMTTSASSSCSFHAPRSASHQHQRPQQQPLAAQSPNSNKKIKHSKCRPQTRLLPEEDDQQHQQYHQPLVLGRLSARAASSSSSSFPSAQLCVSSNSHLEVCWGKLKCREQKLEEWVGGQQMRWRLAGGCEEVEAVGRVRVKGKGKGKERVGDLVKEGRHRRL